MHIPSTAQPGGTPPRSRRVRFFKNDLGTSVAKDEFLALPREAQAALGELFSRFENGGERSGEIKNAGEGLYEFRVRVAGNNPYRAYFFKDGPRYVIVVLCVYKNQEKITSSDKKLAKQRMKLWQARGDGRS